MLNKYGTPQDNSTAYQYQRDGIIPDMYLTEQYETNGLFAKIIDAPAEEAVKHGFELGLKSPEIITYITDMLDRVQWDDKAVTAIKWARLYGGALGVMFINDGGGIEEPLNWRRIKDIDEIRIYERAVVFPDYSSLYNYNPRNPAKSPTSKFGIPEHYFIQSIYGQFWVHESRCLIFNNGVLPERTLNPYYRFWGMPEYARIKRELREAITTHSLGVKLLERSVQAIYGMKDLATTVASEGGENEVIKRLQVIDMARGILNSIAIDADGESYDFKTATMTGVKEIIDSTCNMLSAVTNIPQTILFGRSPAGQNSTGKSDLENYYNYIERIQKLMLKGNLRTLIEIIICAGMYQGKIEEEPDIKLTFNPLWSMTEAEKAAVEQQKAATQHQRAQTAQLYVDLGALGPSEVRAALAKTEEFEVESMLDEMNEEDLWGAFMESDEYEENENQDINL
jgi:phage-related protein (TIGR01555 family)